MTSKLNSIIRLILMFGALGIPTSSHAEGTAAEIMLIYTAGGMTEKETIRNSIWGHYNGLSWANTFLAFNKQPKLFCMPERLTLTPDQTYDMMQRHARKSTEIADKPYGFVVLLTMLDVFPCKPGE